MSARVIDHEADDIDACLRHIIHFCSRPSGVPGGISGTEARQTVPSCLPAARVAGLIPDAEFVIIEWAAESLWVQPADVQAVMGRLVSICDRLAVDPRRLAEVLSRRRAEFPGLLEGRAQTRGRTP